ncbi:MAG: hypothetical protein U0172_02885 [Nitrospiraceae bacterium]
MSLLTATWQLYVQSFHATMASLKRSWWLIPIVVVFFLGMLTATSLVSGLGLVGGFILGALNALLIGAMLWLFEVAVLSNRTLQIGDVGESFGKYFWDVMGVGFVLWIPLMLLDQSMKTNPQGAFLASAVFFLLFVLLNPAPEVMYQLRQGSPLEVIKSSYDFVLDNWIEWFLPLFVVVAPLGATFFLQLSTRLGRGAGLNFLQLLVLPMTTLSAWLNRLGVSEEVTSGFVLLLAPPLTIFMFLFRGHLFHLLHTSSRRQRLYRSTHGL